MTIGSSPPVLHVPARDIPVPSFLSPQAQAVLAAGAANVGATTRYPPPGDLVAWRALIDASNTAMAAQLAGISNVDADVDEIDVDGVAVFEIVPKGTSEDDPRVFFDIHGGALIFGAGAACRAMGIVTANRVRSRTWAVDYRTPPEHPYPAPLDDCLTAYRALIERHGPEHVIVGGASAGGNLAAALILRARDEGTALPAAAVLLTPQVDLTESGDSFHTNLGVDTVLTESLMPTNLLYAGGHNLADPYLSPLFGDFTKGFAPTLLATGTRYLFLSNTVRMHRALRAADLPSELHVLEAAPHGAFFGTAPEDAVVDQEVRRFVDAHWSR